MSPSPRAAGPVPRPGILDIAAYVPGESHLPSGVEPVKLSSNENALGPSPKAIAAYTAAATELARYPDGGATALRRAIAGVYGLDENRIVCGAGSDELISLLTHAYVGPGDETLYSEYGFLMYKIATQACGGTPVIAPEKNFRTDVDALLARATAKTKLVYLANPNNRPARIFLSRRCAGCTLACQSRRSWFWTRRIASSCGATTSKRGSSSPAVPTTW